MSVVTRLDTFCGDSVAVGVEAILVADEISLWRPWCSELMSSNWVFANMSSLNFCGYSER